MTIPEFDHNHVIPPFLGGDTTFSGNVSPYPTDIVQICNKFAISQERIMILKKFIEFRRRIHDAGIIDGFQWLDGSFVENIEKSEGRPPHDIDVITFYSGTGVDEKNRIRTQFPEFASSKRCKSVYMVDHYVVDYGTNEPKLIIDSTAFWSQLFSHRRDNIRKGILEIKLYDPSKDGEALTYLESSLS